MRRTLVSLSLLHLCQSAIQSFAQSIAFVHRVGLQMTPFVIKQQDFVIRRGEAIPKLHYAKSLPIRNFAFKREPRGGQALVRREMRISKPVRSSRRNGSRR